MLFLKTQAGFDGKGKLGAMNINVYGDAGHAPNGSSLAVAMEGMDGVYHIPNLQATPQNVKTDTAANTWCRAPGKTHENLFTFTKNANLCSILNITSKLSVFQDLSFITEKLMHYTRSNKIEYYFVVL